MFFIFFDGLVRMEDLVLEDLIWKWYVMKNNSYVNECGVLYWESLSCMDDWIWKLLLFCLCFWSIVVILLIESGEF